MKSREPKSLDEIYSGIEGRVSRDVFNEVWSKVGEAFAIDPRLIRPSDTFKLFDGFDGWDLGKGADALGKWIEQQRLGTPPEFLTVLDLAGWLQAGRLSKV